MKPLNVETLIKMFENLKRIITKLFNYSFIYYIIIYRHTQSLIITTKFNDFLNLYKKHRFPSFKAKKKKKKRKKKKTKTQSKEYDDNFFLLLIVL
jgi:hypothetical protein